MSDLISRQDAIDAVLELSEKMKDEMLIIDAIVDEIENLPSAEPEPKWIPVTEALPQNYEQIICIDSRGVMMIGMYGEYGWTFPCYMTEPVAWMPLPERWRGDR